MQKIFKINYLVDGRDSKSGLRPDASLRTLQQANKLDLNAGDRLLFKSGDRFTGMLWLDCHGESGNEIVISSYGTGPYPILDGNGEEAAFRLHNSVCVTIEKLKISNWKGTYGIYLTAENAGEKRGLVIRDLDIHQVGKDSREITDPFMQPAIHCLPAEPVRKDRQFESLLFQNVADRGSYQQLLILLHYRVS